MTGGKAARGGELFTQHSSACHAAGKVAPNLANPVFPKTASATFIARTIVNCRSDTAMRGFQKDGIASLSDNEVRDLLA